MNEAHDHDGHEGPSCDDDRDIRVSRGRTVGDLIALLKGQDPSAKVFLDGTEWPHMPWRGDLEIDSDGGVMLMLADDGT